MGNGGFYGHSYLPSHQQFAQPAIPATTGYYQHYNQSKNQQPLAWGQSGQQAPLTRGVSQVNLHPGANNAAPRPQGYGTNGGIVPAPQIVPQIQNNQQFGKPPLPQQNQQQQPGQNPFLLSPGPSFGQPPVQQQPTQQQPPQQFAPQQAPQQQQQQQQYGLPPSDQQINVLQPQNLNTNTVPNYMITSPFVQKSSILPPANNFAPTPIGQQNFQPNLPPQGGKFPQQQNQQVGGNNFYPNQIFLSPQPLHAQRQQNLITSPLVGQGAFPTFGNQNAYPQGGKSSVPNLQSITPMTQHQMAAAAKTQQAQQQPPQNYQNNYGLSPAPKNKNQYPAAQQNNGVNNENVFQYTNNNVNATDRQFMNNQQPQFANQPQQVPSQQPNQQQQQQQQPKFLHSAPVQQPQQPQQPQQWQQPPQQPQQQQGQQWQQQQQQQPQQPQQVQQVPQYQKPPQQQQQPQQWQQQPPQQQLPQQPQPQYQQPPQQQFYQQPQQQPQPQRIPQPQPQPQQYQPQPQFGGQQQNAYQYQQPLQNYESEDLVEVTEHYSDGSMYIGQKKSDLRHGRGKLYYVNGGIYDGEWRDGKMEGFGTLYFASGAVAYEGEFRDDKFEGRGVLYNEEPEQFDRQFNYINFDELETQWLKYEGEFVNDSKEGQGILYLSNGERYEGQFRNDFIHGEGKYYTLTNEAIIGIWDQNKLKETKMTIQNEDN